MKKKYLAAVFLVLMLSLGLFAGSASAGDIYDAVVVATGDDTADCERSDLPGVFVTQDVCNVQTAVNANPGGQILLKGTFHFAEYGDDGYVVPGSDGTVFITNDVEVHGQKRGNRYKTTIKGGTLYSQLVTSLFRGLIIFPMRCSARRPTPSRLRRRSRILHSKIPCTCRSEFGRQWVRASKVTELSTAVR